MSHNNNCHMHIVIGKNFGDEGKGLAVDYFAMRAQKEGMPCLVIRHNGGAQAGHTVDLKDGGRFLFHQLSSGSLRGAATYWSDTFLSDLFKLPEEVESLAAFSRQYGAGKNQPAGARPGIQLFASPACRCVCVDDVLLNMALETVRGAGRHGSCGMGINEAVLRSAARSGSGSFGDSDLPFRITLGEVKGKGAESLLAHLRRNRREYLPERIREIEEELGKVASLERNGQLFKADTFLHRCGEYGELLQNENVLFGAAEAMCRGAELLEIREAEELLPQYGEVIFEGAQGLLLDEQFKKYAPYLTTSRTGLYNPAALLRRVQTVIGGAAEFAEAVYVSRTYVTRHGRGPLPYEGLFDPEVYGIQDLTNLPNEWQGSLRFAPHGTPEEFVREVREDLAAAGMPLSTAIFLTHLGETGGMVCSASGNKSAETWCLDPSVRETFRNYYFSESPYAEDIK